MTYLVASEARKGLYKLIDDIAVSHEPTLIKGKRNAAVLVSFNDWEDIKETLFIASDKELSDSIIRGLKAPFSNSSTTKLG